MSSAIRRAEIYAERKSKGICVCCGKQKAEQGKIKCLTCKENQREYQKKSRELFDSLGICVRCGKEKQAIGFKMCPECIEKSNEINRKSYKKRGGSKRVYKDRKKQGKCVGCSNMAEPGKVRCAKCLEIHNKYTRKYYLRKKQTRIVRSDRHTNGLCYLCGNELDCDNRICLSCSEKMTNNLRDSWGKKINHAWQKENSLIGVRKNENKLHTDSI